MKGMLSHAQRVARADAALAERMADLMDGQNADLRLDRMLAEAARAIKSGRPLAMRIARPDGRVTYR